MSERKYKCYACQNEFSMGKVSSKDWGWAYAGHVFCTYKCMRKKEREQIQKKSVVKTKPPKEEQKCQKPHKQNRQVEYRKGCFKKAVTCYSEIQMGMEPQIIVVLRYYNSVKNFKQYMRKHRTQIQNEWRRLHGDESCGNTASVHASA